DEDGVGGSVVVVFGRCGGVDDGGVWLVAVVTRVEMVATAVGGSGWR
ncbi:hypothetical protein Tco_0249526, partial [Tanacetum coccineum]